MTPDDIARDLAGVGCSCDDMDEADACPNFKDGWCRKESNAIATALRAAEARGYAMAREQAAEIAEPSITAQHGALPTDPWEAVLQVSREIRSAILAMEPEE